MRQPFSKGFFVGGAIASAMTITKGNFPGGHWKQEHDSENAMFIGKAGSKYPKPDNELTFDKLGSVFLSGNATRDDAPNHVRIQTHVPARGRPDLGLDVPGAGLRDPRGPAGATARPRSTSTSPPPTASSAARSPPRAAASPSPRAATARCTKKPDALGTKICILRATRAHLAGSIRKVLPVAFDHSGDLFSGAGGFAAAIAIGAFIGQALDSLRPATDRASSASPLSADLIGLSGDDRTHPLVRERVVASIHDRNRAHFCIAIVVGCSVDVGLLLAARPSRRDGELVWSTMLTIGSA